MLIKLLENSEYSFLKKSDFYKSLDFEEINNNEEFELNIEFCSKDTKDINLFIRIIDLWQVTYCPEEFYNLILKEKPLETLEYLLSITGSKFIKFLIGICKLNQYEINKKLCYISAHRKIWLSYVCVQ